MYLYSMTKPSYNTLCINYWNSAVHFICIREPNERIDKLVRYGGKMLPGDNLLGVDALLAASDPTSP
jgi:hypothetical protein